MSDAAESKNLSTQKPQPILENECAGEPKTRNPSPPAGELVSRSPLFVSDRLNGRLCAVVRHRARAGSKSGIVTELGVSSRFAELHRSHRPQAAGAL